jgi:hypothetical protein
MVGVDGQPKDIDAQIAGGHVERHHPESAPEENVAATE